MQGGGDSLHSSSASCLFSPIRFLERSRSFSVVSLWFAVVSYLISTGVKYATLSIFSTRDLVEDWRVREVLMYLSHPIQASR